MIVTWMRNRLIMMMMKNKARARVKVKIASQMNKILSGYKNKKTNNKG